jgi:hypothetical protein
MRYEIKNEVVSKGLESYVAEFLEDRKSESHLIKGFLIDLNFEEIQKIAHQWKGFSEPYGFKFLGTLGGEMESSASTQDKPALENYYAELLEYLKAKEAELGIKR